MEQGNGNGQPMVPEAPYRCEIKENSKGEPAVSVRAYGDDTAEAQRVVAVALTMYNQAKAGL